MRRVRHTNSLLALISGLLREVREKGWGMGESRVSASSKTKPYSSTELEEEPPPKLKR
jgi:hypothetical protein